MSIEGLFTASHAYVDARMSFLVALHNRIRVKCFCTAFIFAWLAAGVAPSFAQGNVGIGTTTPDPSALLDLSSMNQGFLLPRMTTGQRNTIGSPATSLLIFDNTFNAFWYFDGVAWVPLNSGWQLTGNAATVDGVNFLGTTDNVPFTIRANNLRAIRIEPETNSPNIIGGYQGNYAKSGVNGSVIAGGGVLSAPNGVTTNFDFIGGGEGNIAGDGGEASFSVIGGGWGNASSAIGSSVLGGAFHIAAGPYSSILGGQGNLTYAFAQSIVGQFNDPLPAASVPGTYDTNTFQYPAFIVGGGRSATARYNSMMVDFMGVLELGEESRNSTFGAIPQLKISGSTSGYVGFKAAAATSSHSYTMPAQQGVANTILTNDGSGVLSWKALGTVGSQHFATTTLPSFGANTDNLALDPSKSLFRVSASTAINLSGLADTSNGRSIVLVNVGANSISVTNQDANSTVEYRVITGSGASDVLRPDKSIMLFYDGVTKRWRVLNQTP